MKQLNKILLYIGGGCLLAGFILAVLAFAVGGFRLKGLQTGLPYEERTYQYDSEQVKSLNINDRFAGIKLVASSGNEIQITAYENEQEYYEFSLSPTGELTIEQKVNKQWYDYIMINFGLADRSLCIAVPDGLTGEIDASSGSGVIDITGLKLTGDMTINSKSGNIKVNSLTAQDGITINTKSGRVQFEDVSSGGDMTIATGSGDIKVTSVNAGGTLSVDTKSGKTVVDEGAVNKDLNIRTLSGDTNVSAVQVACNISVKASSSSLLFDNTQADGDIVLDTKSGDIRFQALSAGNIVLISASGTVKGSVNDKRENYTIKATSKSGRVRVPESTGGNKRLDAATKSGDINIDFLY